MTEILVVFIIFIIGFGLGYFIFLKTEPHKPMQIVIPELKIALERPEQKIVYKIPSELAKAEARKMTNEFKHLNAAIQEEIDEILDPSEGSKKQ